MVWRYAGSSGVARWNSRNPPSVSAPSAKKRKDEESDSKWDRSSESDAEPERSEEKVKENPFYWGGGALPSCRHFATSFSERSEDSQ